MAASLCEQEVETPEFKRILESGLVHRERLGLGGSHTAVTYPALDCLGALAAEKVTNRATSSSDLNVYLHVAFREHICPFCHYETIQTNATKEDPQRTSYVRALRSEIAAWGDLLRGSRLSCLYIGGGTPTALPEPELLGLFGLFRDYENNADYRACVETSPITLELAGATNRLATLVGTGVNRFSIGIQTFDEELLHRYRGHDRRTAIDVANRLLGLGVEVNIDLIQDLLGQSDESVLQDIAWIDSLRPDQVT